MKSCTDIILEISSILTVCDDLSHVVFYCDYPNGKHDQPLRRPTVLVGIDEIRVDCVEEQSKIRVGSSPCTVCVNLCLCVPKEINGFNGYGAFDSLLKACKELLSVYDIVEMTGGEMKYSSSLDCLVMPLAIVINNGNAF